MFVIKPFNKEKGFDEWVIYTASGKVLRLQFFPVRLWQWGVVRHGNAIALPFMAIIN